MILIDFDPIEVACATEITVRTDKAPSVGQVSYNGGFSTGYYDKRVKQLGRRTVFNHEACQLGPLLPYV